MDTDKKITPPDTSMPQPLFEQTLDAGHELRITNIKNHIKVLVHEGGLCEVFGRELPTMQPVYFHQDECIAIFCWKPSRIQISGEFDNYSSEQTPMHIYVNLSCALNRERMKALQNKTVGPVLLITGSQQSGKSTLTKILVNYAAKLGWQPTLVDLDLSSGEISPAGCLSAALVTDSETLPSDGLSENTLSYFHGSTNFITTEFYNKQVQELAEAVLTKQQNELQQFKSNHQLDSKIDENDTLGASLVAPVYPEPFASGVIINAFTPEDKQETQTLVKAIQAFNVGVVLVIDYEKLEKDIFNLLQSEAQQQQQEAPKIIKVPKSPGIQTSRPSTDQLQTQLFSQYQDYFRGQYHEVFSKNEAKRQQLGLEEMLARNELDPQPTNLSIDQIKIFEVKGNEIPLSALNVYQTESEWATLVEEIRPQDLEKNLVQKYKHKILAVLMPRDLPLLKQLQARMQQNPNNTQLKEDFNEQLMRSCVIELLQIRDFKVDAKTQKRYLQVVRTCNTQYDQTQEQQTCGLASNYFFLSSFTLKNTVF